jgi:hypothetical protein
MRRSPSADHPSRPRTACADAPRAEEPSTQPKRFYHNTRTIPNQSATADADPMTEILPRATKLPDAEFRGKPNQGDVAQ